MRARSLVFDLYGDYVRYVGGEIAFQALAELLGAFGVREGTARVTVSRLKRDGWLTARRQGRHSFYALTERSWRVLEEGRERIFSRHADPWDGTWYLVIYSVPESARPMRERLRNSLEWLGFGPLGPSTWISPHGRFDDLEAAIADRDVEAEVDLFTAQTGTLVRDRELAGRCWDLARIDRAYAEFARRHRRRTGRPVTDHEAFVARTHLVHDYRKFPFVDPDLPRELLPADWSGAEAHAVFAGLYEDLREPAVRHFESVLARADGGFQPAGSRG